ncbi:WD40-repeat-containing domain protein [Trichophaea hybrida]|nr:WD40-repeat-containing domain protein [Trichophaea hybrida]
MAAYDSHSIALSSDIFSLAVHPTRPIFVAGLSSGHVYTYTWPSTPDDDDEAPTTEQDFTVAWKTHRHKGSCRSAVYSDDGETLYTAGADTLLKAAASATGHVVSKSLLPSITDPATVLLPLSPQHLLLGTDAGHIHLYDLRTPSHLSYASPAASWTSVHEDYISSLLPLPATTASTTGFSRTFIATGDTTLTHLDVRKPGKVLSRSEPQEDEILWFEVEGAGWGTFFAAGSGDGKIRIVKMGGNKTVATLAHAYSADEARRMAGGRVKVGDYTEGLEEGVSALAIDCDGRIVSGGGTVVRIWTLREKQDEKEAEEQGKKRNEVDSDDDKPEGGGSEVEGESSDDEKERKKRKKKRRKGGKGKAKSAGVKNINSFTGLD